MGRSEQPGLSINSPIAKRLRAKAKKLAPHYKGDTGVRRWSVPEGRIRTITRKKVKKDRKLSEMATGTDSVTHPLPPPHPSVLDASTMEDLFKHLNGLHNKTQQSMKEMMDSCKTEINENLNKKINLLSDDMKNIKSEMSKIEKVFEDKISGVQGSVKSLETKVEGTCKDLKKLESDMTKGQAELEEKINRLETELIKNKRSQEMDKEEIKRLQEDLLKFKQENASALDEHSKKVEDIESKSEKEMNELKSMVYANTENIKQGEDKIEDLENRVRSANLLIEGLPENDSLALKTQISDMIRLEFPNHKDADIRYCYRIGKKTGKKRNPEQLWPQ